MNTLNSMENVTVENETIPVDPTTVFGPHRDTLFIVIPITIIYTLIFITGLLGNIFTCLVIVRNKSMHTATNYYLFSLAISDLLLLVSGMPQEMYSIWSKWPYVFGHSFCVIRGLAAETSTNASVLTITLFTTERYLAICHPFVSHKMSKLSRAMKHVILLWIVALGMALPQALQFGIRENKGVIMCLQTRVIIEHSFEISTFCVFFAPMVLITVLYSLMGLKLKQTSINKEQSQKDFEKGVRHVHKIRRQHSQSTRRVVKMLVAVVVAFFVCWAPFHAQRLVAIYGTDEHHLAKSHILYYVYYFLTYTSGVFYYISTCINPIFYHIMSNKFREAFKNTMAHCCSQSSKKTAGSKRCSYTAIAFPRNPTSLGLKNSMRRDSSQRHNFNKQNSRERFVPTMHVNRGKSETVVSPVRNNSNNNSEELIVKEDLGNIKNHYIEDRSCVTHEIYNLDRQVCCIHPSPTKKFAVTPDDISLKEKKPCIDRHLEDIKLKIKQHGKEYG